MCKALSCNDAIVRMDEVKAESIHNLLEWFSSDESEDDFNSAMS